MSVNNKALPIGRAAAVRTGLEPATPGVTGRYSNQLNYRTSHLVLNCECKYRAFFSICKFFIHFFKKIT